MGTHGWNQNSTKKIIKIKSFEKKLHLGFLEFLLGAAEPANPVTPALDDAVLELIIDKKINKTKQKKLLFFFPTLFLSNQKNKTNPPTLRVNLIQNQSLGISEREQKGISQFGRCCLLLLLLF